MALRVSLRGITKIFAPDVVAADDITLDIEPGELFFLLGPSGCGKTTVLRMLAGFEYPTAGAIYFGEQEMTDVPACKRGCGMVFQSYALWPHMNVYRNVEYGLRMRSVEKSERAERVREALSVVRMEQYLNSRPNQLSGGQQQRVALARALVISPDVLLLDEPLSNLDAKLRLEMRAEIQRIHAQVGTTTIYVTHDQEEALSLAGRMAVMDTGRIVQVGTPRQIYAGPATRFVADFIGETNLVPGTVEQAGPEGTTIATGFGRVSIAQRGPGAGEKTWLSIRPEAVEVRRGGGPGPNTFTGKVTQAMYLGDREQLRVQLAGDTVLKVVNHNTATGGFSSGDGATVTVDAGAVILLED